MGNKGIEIVIADGDSTQIAKQIATYASKHLTNYIIFNIIIKQLG